MAEKNLWGDLSDIKGVITPADYLVEQANVLTAQTKGILLGTVETTRAYGASFRSTLSVVVPGLNDYQYDLLTMVYGISLYPVNIKDIVGQKDYKCESPELISDTLQMILSSPAVHKVLGALMAQTRARM